MVEKKSNIEPSRICLSPNALNVTRSSLKLRTSIPLGQSSASQSLPTLLRHSQNESEKNESQRQQMAAPQVSDGEGEPLVSISKATDIAKANPGGYVKTEPLLAPVSQFRPVHETLSSSLFSGTTNVEKKPERSGTANRSQSHSNTPISPRPRKRKRKKKTRVQNRIRQRGERDIVNSRYYCFQ